MQDVVVVAVERLGRPRFASVATQVKVEEKDGLELAMPAVVKRSLGLRTGDPVWFTPVD